MRAKLTIVGCLVGLLVVIAAAPAVAHHAFAAEFDASKPISLQGTITRMEWVNPHSWVHLDVTQSDGTVEKWMVEGGPPTSLLRRGFTKKDLRLAPRYSSRATCPRTAPTRPTGATLRSRTAKSSSWGHLAQVPHGTEATPQNDGSSLSEPETLANT